MKVDKSKRCDESELMKETFLRINNLEKISIVKMMLREGDILYVQSLNRFGRKKEAILNEWKDITKNIKVHIVITDMPLVDTTKYKDNSGNLITDLILQILSWLAEEERPKSKHVKEKELMFC